MKILGYCVFVMVLVSVQSQENPGIRGIVRVYDECSKSDSFSLCLKKKAVTFMDRLARMDKFSILDGVTVVKGENAPQPIILTEEQLENSLPRSIENKEQALDDMLVNKATNYFSSRTLQITLPQLDAQELGRAISEGRGKMKKMMGMMMMGVAAKMAGFIPLALAGLFLLAGKALIIAKIALLISGILAIKKLLNKQGGGSSGGHGGGHGGGGGGWQSSGGGWDKRSYEEAQKLAYKAYIQ